MEHSPDDPAYPCVNYPTEEYESYAECDDHFVTRSLPPGLKPFWTVDNIREGSKKMEFSISGGGGSIWKAIFHFYMNSFVSF